MPLGIRLKREMPSLVKMDAGSLGFLLSYQRPAIHESSIYPALAYLPVRF
jgi:hypothetical protein